MKASKQFSIVLAAAVLAFGAVTVAPQQADASYGYKYTDSQRPPVSTPKLTTPKASTTIENITVTNVAPKYSDYNDIAAYSLAVADYFMAKIMAIYGSGNTALNRYGFGR